MEPKGNDQKGEEEEEAAAGVLRSLAKGLWGFMGNVQQEEKKENDGFSKLEILKVKLNSDLNLKAIFAEKDRIFTDF